jgi:hypothetical protein
MNKVLLILGVMVLTFGSLEPAHSTIITNGDFANGLSGWTINNPGNDSLGIQNVDIDGAGPLQSSDAFFVQTAGGSGSRDVSIYQGITIPSPGTYTLSANIAASYFPIDPIHINNLSGGIVTVALDGRTMASYDFESIAANSWEYASLTASFVVSSTALLDINFYRPYIAAIDSPINYLDNVALVSNNTVNSVAAPVPEPSTVLFLATGLAGFAGFGRKKLLTK